MNDDSEAPDAWLRGFAYGALIAVVAYAAYAITRRAGLAVARIAITVGRDR